MIPLLIATLGAFCFLAGLILGHEMASRKAEARIDGARAREDEARKTMTRLMDSILAKQEMAPVTEQPKPTPPTAEEKRPRTWRERQRVLEEKVGRLPVTEQVAMLQGSYVYKEKKEA